MRLGEKVSSLSARSDLLAADRLRHQIELARGDADVAADRHRLMVGENARAGFLAHQALFAFLSPPPEWPWKVRVGENSPSLWPTMSSVTSTGNVLVAVVDAEGDADELRQDRRAARPGLDHVLAAGRARGFRLLEQIAVDERTFPN